MLADTLPRFSACIALFDRFLQSSRFDKVKRYSDY